MRGDGWQVLSIDAIKAKTEGAIVIGPFGSRMKSDLYVSDGVPVIRGNNISDTRELIGEFVFVSSETADGLRSSNVFPDDLVFPHRGAIGQVGIVPCNGEKRYVLSTSLMKLTCDRSKVDPKYVFYFFRSPHGRHELLKHAATVGTPGIGQPLSSLRSITLPVPPLPEQRAIAHILGTLDDKIEKNASGERRTDEELEHAIRQIVSKAVVSDEVVDIFAAAGLKKSDISILSDEFLAEVRGLPQRNLAVELLRKLLKGEIKTRSKRNVAQARSFAELLEQAVRKYQNRAIETAQVIEELIQLARDMREAGVRGERLNLSDDELAFYDALETNDSAVKVLGDETLKTIARELVTTVRNNVTIDWTLRENARAQLRVYVKRILRKYGYPPDKQEKATRTVLEQAEVLSGMWAVA